MQSCSNFVPNLWKPLLCSNCLKSHSSSAPPSPAPSGRVSHHYPQQLQQPSLLQRPQKHRQTVYQEHRRSKSATLSTTTTAEPTPYVPLSTSYNNPALGNSESTKRKKGEQSSALCDTFFPQRWRPNTCMYSSSALSVTPSFFAHYIFSHYTIT
jgi:hypothetical protein